jgi:hypothetical protein
MSAANCSKYDQLLEQARGSAKYWVPKLCEELRRENSEMSNDDIRERVKKDCIGTWQRDTITDALPEEYKDKLRSELGKKGRQKQLEQAGGTVTTEILPASDRAKDDSYSSTGQKLQPSYGPSPEETNAQPQSELNNSNQELHEAKKKDTCNPRSTEYERRSASEWSRASQCNK